MADKKGRGLLMVYTDVPPEVEDEFNRWYNEEHIPERLAIPGVLNAARYVALQGGPKHLACYELTEPEAWSSPEWQKWLTNPTEWSRRMSPSVVGTTYPYPVRGSRLVALTRAGYGYARGAPKLMED